MVDGGWFSVYDALQLRRFAGHWASCAARSVAVAAALVRVAQAHAAPTLVQAVAALAGRALERAALAAGRAVAIGVLAGAHGLAGVAARARAAASHQAQTLVAAGASGGRGGDEWVTGESCPADCGQASNNTLDAHQRWQRRAALSQRVHPGKRRWQRPEGLWRRGSRGSSQPGPAQGGSGPQPAPWQGGSGQPGPAQGGLGAPGLQAWVAGSYVYPSSPAWMGQVGRRNGGVTGGRWAGSRAAELAQ